MDAILVVALVVLALASGAAAGWFVRARLDSSDTATLTRLAATEATAASLRTQLQQQDALLREHQAQMRAERDQQRERERREAAVLTALSPVQETLAHMQRSVTNLERDRQEQYGQLAEQLRRAQESDESLRQATDSLAGALRSNTARGSWGETQLRRIVEVAGLTRHVDFDEQLTISSDDSIGRPDMVIRLPGAKSISVDAKAPLDAFLRASESGDRADARDHAKAVRGHVSALAKRTYWAGLESSPEFTVCFLPSEAMLSAALDADPTLLDYAFANRVALASPVSLFAVLKTVAYTWTQEDVSAQAHELFRLGNTLYERLATLAKHADDMRGAIERSVSAYNKFVGTLESRVLVTARQFPGIDATKLDRLSEAKPITTALRPLAAAELIDAAQSHGDAQAHASGEPHDDASIYGDAQLHGQSMETVSASDAGSRTHLEPTADVGELRDRL